MIWLLLLAAVGIAGAYFYFNQPDIVHQMGNFWTLAGVGVFMLFMLIGVSYLARSRSRGARRGSLSLLILAILFLLPTIYAPIIYAASTYSVKITWYAYPDIHEYNSMLCRYNTTHTTYLHASLGMLGWTNPRFGIFIGQNGRLEKPIVDLTGHTTRLSNGPIGWKTKFTITVNSTGYYVDGIKICQPGEINLNLAPDSHVEYNITIVDGDKQDPIQAVKDHPALVGLGLVVATLLLLAVKRW